MGELWKIRDYNASTVFWEKDSTDAFGHVQNERFGNGVNRFREYDQANGWLFKLQAGVGGGTSLQNAEVLWDGNANLGQRKDLNQSITETITYDALNRIDLGQRNGTTNLDVTLNAAGSLTSKSDVGSYTYQAGTRRVTAAGANTYGYDANGNVTTRNGSTINYASYDLPTLINAGANVASFGYDAWRQTIKQTATASGVTETTIYVAGLLEKVTKSGVTEYRHKIQTPTGLAALYTRRSSGTNDTYYVLNDHLGSPSVITGSTGTELLKLSFDAYGQRRDRDWDGAITAADLTTLASLTRNGFTGHSQLDAVGLVHMNGRVYDPVLGRFLSVDPILEAGVSQSVHPYSYVWNNPLTHTDPTGFIVGATREVEAQAEDRHDARTLEWARNSFLTSGYQYSWIANSRFGVLSSARPRFSTPQPRISPPSPPPPKVEDGPVEWGFTLGGAGRISPFLCVRAGNCDPQTNVTTSQAIVGTAAAGGLIALGVLVPLYAIPMFPMFELAQAPNSIADGMPPGFGAARRAIQTLPKLQRIHSVETLTTGSARFSYDAIRNMSTDDIVRSLRPGSSNPLTVRSDGRIFDGNTRIFVLEERGFDISALPRVVLGE